MRTVGVQVASKRWKLAGCSLMCTSRGKKFSLMKAAVTSSAYDSASSRAHAPQAGAALKSMSTGVLLVLASASAALASFIQFTFISVSSLTNFFRSLTVLQPIADSACELTVLRAGAQGRRKFRAAVRLRDKSSRPNLTGLV